VTGRHGALALAVPTVTRPARRSPATWDVLGLVVAGGLVGMAYRAW